MHSTAYENCLKFLFDYCKNFNESPTCVDLASYDVNGTVKPKFKHTGVDMAVGPN